MASWEAEDATAKKLTSLVSCTERSHVCGQQQERSSQEAAVGNPGWVTGATGHLGRFHGPPPSFGTRTSLASCIPHLPAHGSQLTATLMFQPTLGSTPTGQEPFFHSAHKPVWLPGVCWGRHRDKTDTDPQGTRPFVNEMWQVHR